MNDQTLTMLIHGETGVGKSWCGDSAPAPRLILDAEGRAQFLPSEPKVLWDPRQGGPPQHDGTWQTCVARVPDYQTMELAYRWLASGQHQFTSVVCDSIMEVQKRFIDQHAGLNPLDQQDWGVVFRNLEKLVRDYRDLASAPSNTIRCVIFITGSRNDNGKQRPYLQGQMAKSLPYIVDAIGYLYTNYSPEGGITRQMLVAPLPQAVAKDDTNELNGPVVVEPDISTMFGQVHHSEVSNGDGIQSQASTVEGGAA